MKRTGTCAVGVAFLWGLLCVGALASMATDTAATTTNQGTTIVDSKSAAPTLTASQPIDTERTSLIVCVVDGSVYTVDAFTGELKSHFITDKPLVTAKGAEDWDERIVPGLDGRLYALKAGPELKPLPLTVMDILSNPVRTCRDGGQDCGIVTGIKTTSLYGFDPSTGMLQWKEAGGQTKRARGHSRDDVSVVLQREDFIVRHISANDGEELWDVSVGKYVALDFGGPAMSSIQPNHEQKLLPGRAERSVPPTQTDLPTIAFDKIGNSVLAINETTGNVLWKRKMSSVIASVYGVQKDGWAPLRVLDDEEFEATIKKAMGRAKEGVASLPSATTEKPGLVLSNSRNKKEAETTEFMKSFLNGEMPSYVRFNTAEHDKGGALVLYEPPDVEGMLRWKTKLNRHESTMFVRSPSFLDDTCVLSPDGSCDPDSAYLDMDRDFGYAGQKLLPPAREGASTINLRGSPTPNASGGLFLSWSVVVAIALLMVATVVALRIVYLHKKHKWVSLAQTPPLLPTNPNSGEDEEEDLAKTRFSLGDGSPSDIHAHSDHPAEYLENWFSSSPYSVKTQSKKKMMRSMSMPMLHDDADHEDDEKQLTVWDPSSNKLPLGASVTAKATKGTTGTAATASSPATTSVPAIQSMESMGPDLIDGVPLVRYSRYRSEFREESALGKGGFGTVFQCINALDGTKYAVKKVWIKSHTDASGNLVKTFSRRLQRVLREVKILALLDHKNIVRYYAAWLEMEEEGTTDDASNVEYGTTTDKKMPRCFSSEFVAGTAGGAASDTQSLLTSGLRNASPLQKKRGIESNRNYPPPFNPLGINNNFFGNEDSLGLAGNRRAVNESEDIGFTFERSGSDLASKKEDGIKDQNGASLSDKGDQDGPIDVVNESSSSSSEASASSGEGESSAWPSVDPTSTKGNGAAESEKGTASRIRTSDEHDRVAENLPVNRVRHTLYIQMQLCSQKSLSDFLSNREARRRGTTSSYGVDIPYALGLFKQIVAGVKHVHQQGLIHRDLKPSNAFIDEAGVVKVGDFGLSRESAAGILKDVIEDSDAATDTFQNSLGGDDDNTAGVGTRSYASPEQMSGSDYDASTDIYSLGIMLFELCYPMYTAMERHIMFDGLRKGMFPKAWKEYIAVAFPSLHRLVIAMLSIKPEQRPSADAVAKQIDSLLGEYTVLSLDLSRHPMDNFILLRVEALAKEGVLVRTQQLIIDAAPGVKILEYGLRGQEAKAIMEFAVSTSEETDADSAVSEDEHSVKLIMRSLEASAEISVARQVSYRRN